MPETLLCSLSERILTITLNRPEKLNAFTETMAEELIAAFGAASEDDDVGAVIVTGAGRAFCAGMDLSPAGNVFGLDEDAAPTLDSLKAGYEDPGIIAGVRDTGGRLTLAIFDCKKPVIAAINGPAVGIGATMTLAMDARLMAASARMGFVFSRLGIVPEAASTWFLPRLVGLQQALEWIYTGDLIDAETARGSGLARSVHAADELLDAARGLASRFIQNRSPVAAALARQMLYRNSAKDHPREAHLIESLAMFYTSVGDGKEGVAAFLEKRAPAFSGRASEMPPFYPWWQAGR